MATVIITPEYEQKLAKAMESNESVKNAVEKNQRDRKRVQELEDKVSNLEDEISNLKLKIKNRQKYLMQFTK